MIALPRGRRCDVDVGSFTRPEAIAKGVEDLPLGKASHARGVVRRQIPRAGLERTDHELLLWTRHSGKPAFRARIRSTTMTAATILADRDESAAQHLILRTLSRDFGLGGERRRGVRSDLLDRVFARPEVTGLIAILDEI